MNSNGILHATNGGTIDIQLTSFTSTGALNATNGGTLNLNGSTAQFTGGQVLADNTSSIVSAAAITQTGGTTQIDGALNLTPGQSPGLTLSGGDLVGSGTIGNATTSGTIAVTNSGGTLKPGDLLPSVTVGTLTLKGNYTQTAGGTLEIDLAGNANYDVLAVTNNANLAGTLNVKLLNGFSPTVGETFNFLTYGSVTGEFGQIVSLNPAYDFNVTYNTTVATLIVTAVPENSTFVTAGLMLVAGGLLRRRRPARDTTQRAA